MPTLTEWTEQLANAVMSADASDLPALATLHSQFQALQQWASDGAQAADANQRSAAGQTAATAEKLLEQIILREVSDADAALRNVAASVADLQQWVNSATCSAAPAAPRAVTPDGGPFAAALGQIAPEADGAINPDDAPLVGEFISEAKGHIEDAEAAVLKLEETPADADTLSAIFRAFHTIKGVAGFLNFRQISALAHAAENILDLARHGKLQLDSAAVDLILNAIDLMKAMVAAVAESLRSGQAIAREERLPALLERLRLCAAGQAASASSAAPACSAAPAAQGQSGATTRPVMEATHPAPAEKSAHAAQTAEATVKVSTDRLDNLINMVGELVIAEAMVRQDTLTVAVADHKLARHMAHLGKLTRELQELSMAMRMVPLHGVFQKMARLARDVARKAGKQIELVMQGGDTELDRNVVEAISDPLVHMIRNAVDHGIEPAEARTAAGKPAAGRVELRACHQAGNVVIEIADDGRGLNKDRILRKAIDNGLVREGQELSEQEIYKLIFHSGLSTAEKVTDISGRGVGMDVVRKNVEALRGRIEIASTAGHGSTFIIRLPLTLAVIDGLVVRVGPQRYILPLTSVERSLRPKAEQISSVQGRGEMCLVRQTLLPLFRLHRLFNVPPRTEDPTQALVVIVQDDQRSCCLMVDELLGQQQVVIKSLGEGLGTVPGVSGGAILGDGNVSLILDVPSIISLATQA